MYFLDHSYSDKSSNYCNYNFMYDKDFLQATVKCTFSRTLKSYNTLLESFKMVDENNIIPIRAVLNKADELAEFMDNLSVAILSNTKYELSDEQINMIKETTFNIETIKMSYPILLLIDQVRTESK